MVLLSKRIVWLVLDTARSGKPQKALCLPPGCQYLHKDLCTSSHRQTDNTWDAPHSWSLFCTRLELHLCIPYFSWGILPLCLQERIIHAHTLEHFSSFPPCKGELWRSQPFSSVPDSQFFPCLYLGATSVSLHTWFLFMELNQEFVLR